VASASPVIAQAVKREPSSSHCLAALAIMAASLGFLWFRTHTHRPVSMLIGTAERMVNEAACLSKLTVANLHLPDDPVESRFLAFVRDPRATVDANSWFDFDRLDFNSGSAILRPESGQQLDDIAAVMSTCPRVRIKIAHRTFSACSAEANLPLCEARAESLKAALESRGIPPDRIAVQGFGEQNPTIENSTTAGRAQNWHMSLQVIQK
jgi:K(+)-stimulated pyrophosphate-energized sodium pump